jgi:hypothetical protein
MQSHSQYVLHHLSSRLLVVVFSCVRFCCDVSAAIYAEPLIKSISLSPFPMWGIMRDLFLAELGDIRA